MAWTTTELLADVRRSGMLPSTSTTGTADADILAQADKEIAARVVPLVLSVREGFYVRTYNYSLTASQSAYRIPARAIAARLRDVLLVFSDGSTRNLVRFSPERAALQSVTAATCPEGFYLEQNNVVVVPPPASTGAATLRLKYFARPNRLVAVGATTTPTVVSVSSVGGNTRITHSASGTTFSTSSAYDIVKATPGFEHALLGVTPVGSGAGYIDISTGDTPSDLSTANNLGDYLSASETSPVIQVPAELHNYVAQRTLARILQSLGDADGMRAAEDDAERMREDALTLISNRVEGEPKKVVPMLLRRRSRAWGDW